MALLMGFFNALTQNTVAFAMVVLGLGFVIFIHELGHFLLAKWNGVKVEKFAIGFDIYNLRLWQKQVGETTYVIGALPLGGYVKMLGEEPGEANSPEAASDPRAYNNKPVSARMAIISAGVIMNVLFGLACFTYVHLSGKREVPAVIGTVIPGMPAYAAGLREGDRVVAVDGKRVDSFDKLRQASIFSGEGQVLRLEVEREGEKEPRSIEIAPRLRDGGLAPTLGIAPPLDLELPREEIAPFVAPAGLDGDAAAIAAELKGGGVLVAVGPVGGDLKPVESALELAKLSAEWAGEPLAFRVERRSNLDAKTASTGPAVTVTIPPNRFVDFGLRMTTGPVTGLRQGGPAERSGLQEGDRLVSVDGSEDFDPMRLPSLAFEAAQAGRALRLEVDRAGGSGRSQRLALTAMPDASPPWALLPMPDAELDVPGLGMSIQVEPKIAAVVPGSPAAEAGLKAGQTIEAVTLTRTAEPGAAPESEEAKPREMRYWLAGSKPPAKEMPASWPGVFQALQRVPAHAVQIKVAGAAQAVTLTPKPVADWYYPWRGLQFLVMVRKLPARSALSAIASAWGETVDNISFVYYLIRGLIQGRMSTNAVGGPIPIAQMAFASAKDGLETFLPFLGMLSINLAVINFLPIPPLDGGHMLFLILEKIRGRPVPEKYATPVMLAGLALILLLFLLVNIKDIMSLF